VHSKRDSMGPENSVHRHVCWWVGVGRGEVKLLDYSEAGFWRALSACTVGRRSQRKNTRRNGVSSPGKGLHHRSLLPLCAVITSGSYQAHNPTGRIGLENNKPREVLWMRIGWERG
jgi:hypothetical protein